MSFDAYYHKLDLQKPESSVRSIIFNKECLEKCIGGNGALSEGVRQSSNSLVLWHEWSGVPLSSEQMGDFSDFKNILFNSIY